MTTEVAVQLKWATNALAELCGAIDDGADLDQTIISTFSDLKSDLTNRVGDVVSFIEFCNGAIERSKQARDVWAERARKLEHVLEKTKALVLETMHGNPELPYTSPIGRLALQKNPPRVDTDLELRIATVRNVVTADDIEKHKIESRFVKSTIVQHLAAEDVKTALEQGETLPWARQVQGQHLRIRS